MQRSHLAPFIVITGIASVCLIATSCWSDEAEDAEHLALIESMYGEYRNDFPGIAEISAQDLVEWLSSDDVVIVDVRKRSEREVSKIPKSITRKQLDAYLEKHADHRVVAYCTIGYRSGKFTQSLKKKGVEAYNLKGGILAWAHQGGPIVNDELPTNRVHVYGIQWSLLPTGYEPVW